jgi:hypothetical protein
MPGALRHPGDTKVNSDDGVDLKYNTDIADYSKVIPQSEVGKETQDEGRKC